MESVFTAFDVVNGLLAAGALAMIAFARKGLKAARLLIVIFAILMSARWIMWAVSTDQPWWARAIIGGLIGALLLSALPALYFWTQDREATESTNIVPANKPPTPAQAAPTPQSTAIQFGPNATGNKVRVRTGIFGFDRGVASEGKDNSVDSGVISRGPMPPGYKPPAPSIPPVIDGSLKSLTNAELKEKILVVSAEMVALEVEYHQAPFTGHFADSIRTVQEKFSTQIRPSAFALRNELLRRLNQPLTWELETTLDVLEDGPLAGPSPLTDAAHTLTLLAQKLS